ncbi:MAG: PSD1 domain-containing protein [Alphaproteobacteria bacterium]|nr:PSD1 domain-containing protein [Alphaproteobacteria bacterium]
MRQCLTGLFLSVCVATPVLAQTPDTTFFETRIRPVLATNCYGCHSASLAAPKGGVILDTKEGLRAQLVPGKPDESRIIEVLSYEDPVVQMPPKGKLSDAILADIKQWIAAGAVDPREAAPATVASATPQYKGMSLEEGRKWWAFQPVAQKPAPKVAAFHGGSKIDSFVLAKLAEKKLAPSQRADKRTLVTRAYIDLVGYKPTYQEVQAFVADKAPDAYAKLLDRLMASPQYGERWGRHWMDVVRYAEDNPTSEATNPPYPYAWRYRDWIVQAVNADMPYDRFVKLQLAADLMPDAKRDDLRALGYLGAAPIYHHDLRLSGDVIGGFLTDDWDERIDAVSRGLLGVSIGCARCHDHKFDPFTQKDYYALQGVFASTMRAERPMFQVDAKTEQRYMQLESQLFDMAYSINLLKNEGSTFTNGAEKASKWQAMLADLKAQAMSALAAYPQLITSLEKFWTPRQNAARPAAPAANVRVAAAGGGAAPAANRAAGGRGGRGAGSSEPYMNAVFEAAQYVDASDLTYTFITYKPGEARDMPVLKAGNVASPGAVVPRGFPAVLAKGDAKFTQGSGRLELANRIFTDSQGLAARVIVNRVWAWHFGRGLVNTPSDFGSQGEKPSHPELLDDLAARFIAHKWSLKWLNREIMLSATYQQASRPRAEALKADEANELLWRQNPQRLDSESYRDTLVRSAGLLDTKVGGEPGSLDDATYYRRAIYGRVSRARSAQMEALFDFPAPVQTAPNRDVTTSTLQQVYLMNSPFVQNLAEGAVKAATAKTPAKRDQPQQVAALYRQILARNPTPAETSAALAYLQKGSLPRFAQILLMNNEEIFVP